MSASTNSLVEATKPDAALILRFLPLNTRCVACHVMGGTIYVYAALLYALLYTGSVGVRDVYFFFYWEVVRSGPTDDIILTICVHTVC